MSSRQYRLSRGAILGVLVLAIGLSACGRRGALEPPPSAAAMTGHHGQQVIVPPEDQQPKPRKPFFLDWLL